MKRVALTLIVGAISGVALALAVGRSRGNHRANERASVAVPRLKPRANEVVHWIDLGLLRLAEREYLGATLEGDEIRHDAGSDVEAPLSLQEQRDELYRSLSYELGIPDVQLTAIRDVVEASLYLGQGNPAVSVHPISRQRCREQRAKATVVEDDQPICGAPNMVALFDAEKGEPTAAKLCVDQFEFPNIACEYPVVWVRASEAARICRILDKRLCDAHEWEGACAGKLRPAVKEYEAYAPRLTAEYSHNRAREQIWATGFRPDGRTCATGTQKTLGCVDASWEQCGTNSYPAGALLRCVSPFGVYDLHGNVAEHMNLPLKPDQLGSVGGVGETEMKGSWFAFDEYHPHPDDCRWRAPAWHATPIDSETSHFNYHLGFRCCRDLD